LRKKEEEGERRADRSSSNNRLNLTELDETLEIREQEKTMRCERRAKTPSGVFLLFFSELLLD
jgi:hypothetical protein